MKINFQDFKLTWIDWKEVDFAPDAPELHQIIWNKIWEFSSDLWLKEIAEKIYRGEEVELNSNQVEFIRTTMSDAKVGLLPFFGRELNLFLEKY